MKLFSFITVLIIITLSYIKSIEIGDVPKYEVIKDYYREKGANLAFILCIYFIPSPSCYDIIKLIEEEIENEKDEEEDSGISNVSYFIDEETQKLMDDIEKIHRYIYRLRSIYMEKCEEYFDYEFCNKSYREFAMFMGKLEFKKEIIDLTKDERIELANQ